VPATSAYITFAGVRNGDDVLDVGSGTGSLADTVEEGMPASEVVGVDPSEGFIAYAQKNAKSPRVRFEVGDAQALKFKDASFDNTLALLVMNFVPDENKAVAEMRRVTRAQGTVSACVWDYDAEMQMLRFFWDEAVALDPAIEPKDERHCEAISPGTAGRSLEEGWTDQRQGGAAGDRPSVFIIQRLLGAVYRTPGEPMLCRFPKVTANSSNRVCASACLEIARMAHLHLRAPRKMATSVESCESDL
jgi:SAM-dependent methyltransferase